jgi:UPF0176 protein
MFTVAAFYRFEPVADAPALRGMIRSLAERHGIKGTVLVAPEGLNGTVAASAAGIDAFLTGLRALPGFAALEAKLSQAAAAPFRRLKVRLKKEIVTLGVGPVPVTARPGRLVAPQEWDALIADPGVTLIDTRNHFEVELGSFPGAIDPGTRSFGGFPDYVRRNLDPARHTRIAMFCTGGIRCEKASSWLLSQGFAEVSQLHGGILRYLEVMPPDRSSWQGRCFVFDERIALAEGLDEAPATLCPRCQREVMNDRPRCDACAG